MPSPHSAHTMRSPLYPGNSSGGRSTFTHCLRKKVVVGHFAIGQHLLLVFVFDFGMHLASQRFGRFFGGDADGFAGADVDEGGGHLSPVAKFQGALAEAASGDDGDGVGGAAVDFDEGDQALAVFTARVFDAEFLLGRASPGARRGPGRRRDGRGLFRLRGDSRRGISSE